MAKLSKGLTMKLAALVSVSLLALAPVARADEAIATHANGQPAVEAPPAETSGEDRQKTDNGAWARRVMAGQPGDEAAADKTANGCQRNPDRAPHGEVWAGVGTGGYRNVGGVVTQPLGDCAQVTVAIDHTEGGYGRRRR